MQIFFIDQDLENYLFSLEKPTISKIIKLIDLLEIYGEKLGMPHSKYISKNIYELRIRGQQEIRIFYCFHNNQAIFVHAFIKKSQKTPPKEIKTAQIRISMLT